MQLTCILTHPILTSTLILKEHIDMFSERRKSIYRDDKSLK